MNFFELGSLIDYGLAIFPWRESIAAFSLIFLADVFWVLCVRRVQNNQAFMAGIWAAAIFVPTAIVTVGYVNNPWIFIPATLGHFFGTYATVKWEARKK